MSLLIAAQDDIPAIMQLIDDCIVDMQEKGIDQWGDFYPTEDIIADDIGKESLYYLEIENQIAGIIVLNEEADPLYSTVQWLTHDKQPLLVHRLAIDPAFQGQGYGNMMMQWAEGYAKSHDYTTIRLDAYQGNPAAMALYEKNEYIKTGEVTFPHRSLAFNCYEKSLDDSNLITDNPGDVNNWFPIYETNCHFDELADLLEEKGFTVSIFCDPQCRDIYVPGQPYRISSRIVHPLYVAVSRDQRMDAERVLEQWQRQEQRENFHFRMSTFSKAMFSTCCTLLVLGIIWFGRNNLPLVQPEKEVTMIVVFGVLLWTGIFLYQIHRQPPSD